MDFVDALIKFKRRMEKDVLYYLITHPDIMMQNENKKIADSLLNIEALELQNQKKELSYETARRLTQWKCESEAQSTAVHSFEQNQIELFHPDHEKNDEYYESLIIAMALYFCDEK